MQQQTKHAQQEHPILIKAYDKSEHILDQDGVGIRVTFSSEGKPLSEHLKTYLKHIKSM